MDLCVGRTRYYRAFVLVACLAVVGFGLPALAQENPMEVEEELSPEQRQAMEQSMEKSFEEEITVTGSLIPRPTTEAMSPVSTIEPEELTYSGVTRIEDLVAQMPQVFAVQNATVRQGIETVLAKKMVKLIKEKKMKVQAAIQGEKLRITGKKRDDLQDVMALLREADLGVPLQFDNFRD